MYPITYEADYKREPSRVKSFFRFILVIPWLIVAYVYIIAAIFTLLAAWVAIIITGRYPEGLYNFNSGVLRYFTRVNSFEFLLTDEYPPFGLRPDPTYPADVEIPYPERLSRWQAPLKPWLLAIPHYAALAALVSGWGNGSGFATPGLLGVLLCVALVLLLVRGRYPRDLFSLVVGINRWALRVAAYAGLMRDEYPPFRLDR